MASNVEFNFDRADNRLLVSTLRMLLYPHEHTADPQAKPKMMINRGYEVIRVLSKYGSPKVSNPATQLSLYGCLYSCCSCKRGPIGRHASY